MQLTFLHLVYTQLKNKLLNSPGCVILSIKISFPQESKEIYTIDSEKDEDVTKDTEKVEAMPKYIDNSPDTASGELLHICTEQLPYSSQGLHPSTKTKGNTQERNSTHALSVLTLSLELKN